MSKHKKIWEDLPKVKVFKPNLDEFYRFMYERHMIWYRRFVLKQAPPWTENKILRDYKFTNIYRELDRGTLWYTSNVVKPGYDLKQLVWYTTMYRLLNRIETFEKVGLISFTDWKEKRISWREQLKTLHKKESIFTNAHLTLPTHTVGKSKIDTYIECLDELFLMLDDLVVKIEDCELLENLFDILMDIPCVGRFISYEICCDLMLVQAVPFAENDWANAGPGCRHGIKLIFPNVENTPKAYLDKMKDLQTFQCNHFDRLNLKFPFLYPGKPLTLRSIEHSLCEFCKFIKMIKGVGKQRMKFVPKSGEDPRGQFPMRFPREKDA